MFTGLIQVVGRVIGARPSDAGRRVVIDPAGWDHRPRAGESIAINGCCLTVAEVEGDGPNVANVAPNPAPNMAPNTALAFDAVPETLDKTTIGRLEAGSRVNLEHAATPTTLLGGHIVQGHVDGVGEVLGVFREEGRRVRVSVPADLIEYATPKGSVAVEGVSLTIASLNPRENWLEVALIPETLHRTTLGDLRPGSPVNLEMDAMAKTVVHWAKHYGGT